MAFNPNCYSPGFRLQIRDSSVVGYMIPPKFEEISKDWPESKKEEYRQKRKERALTVRKTAYSGKMTSGSRKRMIKACELLCQISPARWIWNPVNNRLCHHRLSFITLTISSSQNITCRQAYDLVLVHFLQWLRRTIKVAAYVWKAELQQRGQIHFHIITPNFIHYKLINAKWNDLQRQAGLLDEYAKKKGHFRAPSTEIKEMRNARKGAAYIAKELAKDISGKLLQLRKHLNKLVKAGTIDQEQAEEIFSDNLQDVTGTEGKIWGCSDNLSEANYFTIDLTKQHFQQIAKFIQAGNKFLIDDWFCVFDCGDLPPPDILNPSEKKAFDLHLYCIANHEKVKRMESELFK